MNLLSAVKAVTKEKYTGFKQKIPLLKDSPYMVKILLVALISIIIGFIISPITNIRSIGHYHVGDVAKQTIYAPQDIEATDVVGTEKNTEKVLQQLPPVFRYNPFIKPRM